MISHKWDFQFWVGLRISRVRIGLWLDGMFLLGCGLTSNSIISGLNRRKLLFRIRIGLQFNRIFLMFASSFDLISDGMFRFESFRMSKDAILPFSDWVAIR